MGGDNVLGDFMSEFSAAYKEFKENVQVGGRIQFPIEVSSIESGVEVPTNDKSGDWVSIRPVNDTKSYLGIYLGDMIIDVNYTYHTKKKLLTFISHHNPAIYVPDLKRVVWGCESWWGVIKSPKDLKQITDADIENIWYVKALQELTAKENSNERIEDDHTS